MTVMIGREACIDPMFKYYRDFKIPSEFKYLNLYIVKAWNPDFQDIFERKMEFYRREYERELDDEIRFGVRYDIDSSGTFSDSEKEATISLRLKR